MSEKQQPNILIIGNPHSHRSAKAFLQKFTKIIARIGEHVYVISGDDPSKYDNVVWIKSPFTENNNLIKKFFLIIKNQIGLIILLWKKMNNFQVSIILNPAFLIPIILLKLNRKKVALFVDGKTINLLTPLARINFMLSDVLLVESENVVNEWNIQKYEKKMHYGATFVDTNFYIDQKEINKEDIVGFMGVLEEGKGILNFLDAIPIVLKQRSNLKFLIAGDGKLFKKIKEYIDHNNLSKNVEILGWVAHDDVPNYLSKLKLLVLPSVSEGLPNIVLESMSCKTPVLATSVGGIPDIINNGENGFILENNSPKCIAANIINILDNPKLEQVSFKAFKMIEKEFSYESALNRYREILYELY